MANLEQEIKKAMNQSMTKESYFSEIEKQKVRHKINQMPTNQTKVKRHLFPKALTGIAVAGFMLFIGGVIESNLELSESPPSTKNGSQMEEEQIVTPSEDEIQTRPVTLHVNNDQELYLPTKLQPIYQEYSITKDDGLLRDLSPFEVFQLYFYAEEQEDFETQYALFIHDEMYIKVFETYEEYLDAIVNPAVPIKEEDKLLSKIKLAVLEERVISEDSAFVSIGVNDEEGLGFGLTKSSSGVWKINWLPIQ